MTRQELNDALDGARLVQVRWIQGQQYVQVWHGGTTVNVYTPYSADELIEQTAWSLSDERGRPCDRDEVKRHMEMWFDRLEEEPWE